MEEKKSLLATEHVNKESMDKEKQKLVQKVQNVVNVAEEKSRVAIENLKVKVREILKDEVSIGPEDGRPFHLTALDANQEPTGFVLETNPKDKYAPRKTGVFNVFLAELNPDPNYKPQQWFYNTKTHGLHSVLYPSKVLFEGMNNNLIVYTQIQKPNQQFYYNNVIRSMINMNTKNTLEISGGVPKHGANLDTGKFEYSDGQYWGFAYAD